jgi:hypothetical protein
MVTTDWNARLIAALLFGLHPVHIESIAWISGVTEPLGAVPFLAATICYIKARHSARPSAWLVPSVALYAVALLNKETTIVLPAVLAVYEWLWPDPRRRRPVARLAPFVIVAAAYITIRQIVLSNTAHSEMTVESMVLTWPALLWFYTSHLTWPISLSLVYNFPPIEGLSLRGVVVPMLLIVLLAAGIWWFGRTRRIVLFGALWILLTLLPPLYLRAFSPEIAHDRYLYLPSVGFCLVTGWCLSRHRGAVMMLAMAYGGLTLAQIRPWANEVVLLAHAHSVARGDGHVERQLAFALQRTNDCEQAMPMLAALIDRNPNDAQAMLALASCYFRQADLAETERLCRRTIEVAPHYQQPYLLLAAIRLIQNRVDEAEREWHRAVDAQAGPNEEATLHLASWKK